jgi:hypothetical protein
VLVVGSGVAGLGGEVAGGLGERGVIGDEHATSRGGNDLVAVEGMYGGAAEGAGGASAVGGSEGFGGILDEGDAVALAGIEDGIDVGGLPVEVGENKGARCPTLRCLAGKELGDEGGVGIPTDFLGIDENGLGAELDNRGGGGDEGEGGADDLVAWLYAGEAEGKVEGGGAGGESDGVGGTDAPGEVALEGIDIGPDGRDPVTVEGFLDVGSLGRPDVGRREIEAGWKGGGHGGR